MTPITSLREEAEEPKAWRSLPLPPPAYYHWPRDGQLCYPSLLLGVPKGAEALYTEAQMLSQSAMTEEEIRANERERISQFVEDEYIRQFMRPWRDDLAAAIRAVGVARMDSSHPEYRSSGERGEADSGGVLACWANIPDAEVLRIAPMAGNFTDDERVAFCAGFRRCALALVAGERNYLDVIAVGCDCLSKLGPEYDERCHLEGCENAKVGDMLVRIGWPDAPPADGAARPMKKETP